MTTPGATPSRAQQALTWLRSRDRDLAATRRAARAALIMPGLFAVGDKLIGNPALATFAAFGSFAMVLLVDFRGPMRNRLQAQTALAVTGGAFVVVGTLASRSIALAAAAMAVVAFAVLFAGIVSSVLAAATTSLLLAFILSASLSAPVAAIPARLEGWGMASGAALLALVLLWPAPERDPLRGPASAACRAMAARLHADVECIVRGPLGPALVDRDAARERATAAAATLRQAFFATPYRPTGLGTATRMVVRLVDELGWLQTIVFAGDPGADPRASPRACAVRSAAAVVLQRGADLLDDPLRASGALEASLAELEHALERLEHDDALMLPAVGDAGEAAGPDDRIGHFISSLDPSFRAQELSFAVSQIAANIALAAAADRRGWWERLLGRRPDGAESAFASAQERAGAHIERHSVWLHNSVRGAIALALAVLVSKETGVQHSFWVVLGTLSVLRSNALSTGQNALRGLLGTVAGFIIGGILVALLGTNTTLLWILLPAAVFLAGLAPAAISFAAGQAAFTLTLLILFNILAPVGWQIGLVRVEDIALGGAVSLLVGVLFWPRGAGAALGRALAAAYDDGARYLDSAVAFGLSRCDHGIPSRPAPVADASRSAASARRLDDAFRGYLAERGAKPVPLADVTGLVTGVAGLRLAADAVLDLWRRDDDETGGDRAAARRELSATSERITGWYTSFGASLIRRSGVPDPVGPDLEADARLIAAVSRDLRGDDGRASVTAARMVWTGDHLDAARRLQQTLVEPARTVAARAGARTLTSAIGVRRPAVGVGLTRPPA